MATDADFRLFTCSEIGEVALPALYWFVIDLLAFSSRTVYLALMCPTELRQLGGGAPVSYIMIM